MSYYNDKENESSCRSKENDSGVLHTATNLLETLQETANLINFLVGESNSSLLQPLASSSNGETEKQIKSDFALGNLNSAANLEKTKIVNESKWSFINDNVDKIDNIEENKIFCSIDPEPTYWEENVDERTLNNVDDIISNIDTLSAFLQEDIKKSEKTEINNTSQSIEPTISALEREILLRGETPENKKSKILQLPPETIPSSPSHCEREIMGDDVSKNNVHIVCECDQPSVAGAAVPVISSFATSEGSNSRSKIAVSKNHSRSNRPSLIPKPSASFSQKHFVSETKAVKQLKNISFKTDLKSLANEIVQKEELNDAKRDKHIRYKKLTEEFSAYVSKLAKEATNLSEIESSSAQLTTVDTIYKHITNLKKIANELKAMQSNDTMAVEHNNNCQENVDSETKSKLKDRIYIKFLPSKCGTKKKICDCQVQNDFESKSNKALNDPRDSMDGMFIPSFDEPPSLVDEEDDEDGLDITIRFPECKTTLNEDGNSHLSVCFSSLSAEALGHLKRCPKEFTLRMDFLQGKMFFQSGKSVNNFAIGPDLKITECIIDSKQSDIINIKPSTECCYNSQIIPVEGTSGGCNSVKLLKSVNSELFSVVSLPFFSKRFLATKSCTSIKHSASGIAISASHGNLSKKYKSMPQIPSRWKLLDDYELQNAVSDTREALNNCERKSRSRSLQRKTTNASLDYLL